MKKMIKHQNIYGNRKFDRNNYESNGRMYREWDFRGGSGSYSKNRRKIKGRNCGFIIII